MGTENEGKPAPPADHPREALADADRMVEIQRIVALWFADPDESDKGRRAALAKIASLASPAPSDVSELGRLLGALPGAIAFARDAFRDDGAEGETVHLLVRAAERLRDERDRVSALLLPLLAPSDRGDVVNTLAWIVADREKLRERDSKRTTAAAEKIREQWDEIVRLKDRIAELRSQLGRPLAKREPFARWLECSAEARGDALAALAVAVSSVREVTTTVEPDPVKVRRSDAQWNAIAALADMGEALKPRGERRSRTRPDSGSSSKLAAVLSTICRQLPRVYGDVDGRQPILRYLDAAKAKIAAAVTDIGQGDRSGAHVFTVDAAADLLAGLLDEHVDVHKNAAIICNRCGLSCELGDTGENGGLLRCIVTGGYNSTPGNGDGALDDLDGYEFSICEFCLDWLFQTFKVQVNVHEVSLENARPISIDGDRVFVPAALRVARDGWREMKEKFRSEAARRARARTSCAVPLSPAEKPFPMVGFENPDASAKVE